MDRLLNSREVADLLGLHPRYLNAMCRAGRFPTPIKLSPADQGQRRWRSSVVEAWIAEREAEAGRP